jgi:hypothetical protein
MRTTSPSKMMNKTKLANIKLKNKLKWQIRREISIREKSKAARDLRFQLASVERKTLSN